MKNTRKESYSNFKPDQEILKQSIVYMFLIKESTTKWMNLNLKNQLMQNSECL